MTTTTPIHYLADSILSMSADEVFACKTPDDLLRVHGYHIEDTHTARAELAVVFAVVRAVVDRREAQRRAVRDADYRWPEVDRRREAERRAAWRAAGEVCDESH